MEQPGPRGTVVILGAWLTAVALAGTARAEEMPPYPNVTRGLQAAQALVVRMSEIYDVRTPTLRLDTTSSYSRGTIYLRKSLLDSDVMEAVLAHEFTHYMFGHSGFLESNEVAADAKVVEILQRARGYSRGEAFQVQYRRLSGIHRSDVRLQGHMPPCVELRIFLAEYPEYRDFVRATGGDQDRPCFPAGW